MLWLLPKHSTAMSGRHYDGRTLAASPNPLRRSPLIAHPAMHTTPPRVDEEDMLEAKVLAQPGIQNLRWMVRQQQTLGLNLEGCFTASYNTVQRGARLTACNVGCRQGFRLQGVPKQAASLAQRQPPDLDGCRHERPALGADVALLAARPHVVVICQVNIEHQLALHRRKALPRACRGQAHRQANGGNKQTWLPHAESKRCCCVV